MSRYLLAIAILFSLGSVVGWSQVTEELETEIERPLVAADVEAAGPAARHDDDTPDAAEHEADRRDNESADDLNFEQREDEERIEMHRETGVVSVVVHTLQSRNANEVADMIQRLFPELTAEGMVVHADNRTNTLIVRGAPDVHERIREFLFQIDRESRNPMAQRSPNPDENEVGARTFTQPRPPNGVHVTPPFPPGPDRLLLWRSEGAPGMIEEERRILLPRDAFDRETTRLAVEIQRQRLSSEPDEETLAALERRLTEHVRRAFEARQQLQRRELAVLEEQLKSIQRTIEAREKDKDKLVKRRVKQLLESPVYPDPFASGVQ